ncbi:MAG: ATP-binding protein [Chloroflexota bacterium]
MATPNELTPRQQQVADDIQVLKGLDHVRFRPGMYIGSRPDAIDNMLYAVLDNSINEAMVRLCDKIELVIHADGSITISDNGSGIPVAIYPREGISQLEVELTIIFAGGRIRNPLYCVWGGMHGIGLNAVNALSESLIAEVRRDGYLWRQSYARGVRTSDLEQIRPMNEGESTGTSITFYPDAEIFLELLKVHDFNFNTLANRCRELAYILPGLTIHLVDQRETGLPRETTFYFEGGLTSFVKYLNRSRNPLHTVISGTKTVYVDKDTNREKIIEIDFAFQYTDDLRTTELTFVNTVQTPDGGTHWTGFRTALTRTINKWAHKTGFFKDNEANFIGQNTLEGLTAVVSIKHPYPQFKSQTNVVFVNPEVKGIVASVVSEFFTQHLESNPDEAQRILDRCRRARAEAEAWRNKLTPPL